MSLTSELGLPTVTEQSVVAEEPFWSQTAELLALAVLDLLPVAPD